MLNLLRSHICGPVVALAFAAAAVAADPGPVPPCRPDKPIPHPPFPALGSPPTVALWRNIPLAAGDCFEVSSGAMDLVVVLSGRFRSADDIEEIAARVGAISAMKGMNYWSVTDGEWRELVSEAYAVSGPDNPRRRDDFTAAEVLSGEVLYFMQDDTRSTGLNLYSLTARRIGSDGLAIDIRNLGRIKYLLVTLFDPGALVSLQIVRHLQDDEWGYYGLSAVAEGSNFGHESSWINRAVAYQRLLTGEPTDGAPPLAP